MKSLLYILFFIAIIALFVYSKLAPHQAKLTGQYLKTFLFCEKVFNPVLNLLRKIVKPAQVGNGIAVDMSQIALLILFLICLRFIS